MRAQGAAASSRSAGPLRGNVGLGRVPGAVTTIRLTLAPDQARGDARADFGDAELLVVLTCVAALAGCHVPDLHVVRLPVGESTESEDSSVASVARAPSFSPLNSISLSAPGSGSHTIQIAKGSTNQPGDTWAPCSRVHTVSGGFGLFVAAVGARA